MKQGLKVDKEQFGKYFYSKICVLIMLRRGNL